MNSYTKSDKVVLDTNIIISALIAKEGTSAKTFERMILNKITNHTSNKIIDELIEVLNRKEITKRTTKKAREFILKNYLDNSKKVKPRENFSRVSWWHNFFYRGLFLANFVNFSNNHSDISGVF